MTLEEIRNAGYFNIEDMDIVYAAYQKHCNHDSSEWEYVRHTNMRLPEWYNHSLDVMSDEYAIQQHKLWKAIVNVDREYIPALDELTLGQDSFDPVKYPGWNYANPGDNSIATESDHIIATGMIMKNSGVRKGQWVLEYGAGFGKTSIEMARLGANVDTVDVSDYYCDSIKQQANFYNIPLTSFKGEFGLNPRGDQKYDLIFFYECFHHCLEFKKLIPLFKNYLTQTGKIIMAGEPIIPSANATIPYEWGIRLDVENLAIMRFRKWFELGFTEGFIRRIFNENGFTFSKMECHVSGYAQGYIFTHSN